MSDATAATAAPPAAAPAAAAPAGAAAGGAPDAAKERRVRNATTFLKNPQVRTTPLSRRVNFLTGKGLNAEEIQTAFQRAGVTQSLESIQDVISGKTASLAAQPAAAATTVAASPAAPAVASAAPAAVAGAPVLPAGAPPAHVQYVYAQPPPQPAAAKKEDESWTWKDYFIGATMATVGSAAAVKAFTAFSPYDIVRKDELSAAQQRMAAAPSVASAGRLPQMVAAPQQQLFAAGADPMNMSSATFAPALGETAAPVVAPAPRVALPQVAPAPAEPSTAGGDSAADRESKDAEIAKLKEELEAAKAEASQTKEQLDKVRREKAEMAVTLGKVKGQMVQQQRSQERAESAIEARVEERVAAELKKRETGANPATSTAAAGDGSETPVAAASESPAKDDSASTPEPVSTPTAGSPPSAKEAAATPPKAAGADTAADE